MHCSFIDRHTYGEVSDAIETNSKAVNTEHTAGKEGDSGKLQCYLVLCTKLVCAEHLSTCISMQTLI